MDQRKREAKPEPEPDPTNIGKEEAKVYDESKREEQKVTRSCGTASAWGHVPGPSGTAGASCPSSPRR